MTTEDDLIYDVLHQCEARRWKNWKVLQRGADPGLGHDTVPNGTQASYRIVASDSLVEREPVWP